MDDDGNGFVDDVHGADFVNRDGDPSDDNGHGTHVAGIAAGSRRRASGVARDGRLRAGVRGALRTRVAHDTGDGHRERRRIPRDPMPRA